MKIRFQADADLNEDIIWGEKREEPMVDFQTADDANLRGLADDAVLALAASENRILISHDRKTMPGHVRAELEAGRTVAGVFIVPQRMAIAQAINDLHILVI